ncbi:MAG: hypothetical protein ACPL4H_09520, partial [Anaerolineales bacterium]
DAWKASPSRYAIIIAHITAHSKNNISLTLKNEFLATCKATFILPLVTLTMNDFYYRKLPHWHPESQIIFITF